MRWEVIRIRVKRGGFVSRRSTWIEAPFLRFGRSTDVEVQLSDPRVHLRHAELHREPHGLVLTGLSPGAITIGGRVVGKVVLLPGDAADVGPFTLRARAGGVDDATVEVELAHPLGDDLEGLRARSVTSLREAVDLRWWSLGAFAVVLLAGLGPAAALLGGGDGDMEATTLAMWSTGSLAGVHRHFGARCETCHAGALMGVRDEACLACHHDLTAHADPAAHDHPVLAQRCAACHEDHNGRDLMTVATDAFCVRCHADPEGAIPAADLDPVSDFGLEHPELRALVFTGPNGEKTEVDLGPDRGPVQRNNLKFSHVQHLGALDGPDGVERLGCADCHATTPGPGMSPPRRDERCARCHAIRLDPRVPGAEIPHGDAALAKMLAKDAFAAAGLAVEEVRATSFGEGLCGDCHVIEETADGWDVAPPRLAPRYLIHGLFDHRRHTTNDCETCHEAALTSAITGDLLLPGIATCRACHGGEGARDKVPSTCASCHDFHLPGRPVMTAR